MKKLAFLIAFTIILTSSFAQVQRKTNKINKPDSVATDTMGQKEEGTVGKREMMKELNLSKEQKIKLKEARQSLKAKKDAIENDDKLSAPEKEAKLKELRKEQVKTTISILNDEQKAKMLQMRKENKAQKMEETEK